MGPAAGKRASGGLLVVVVVCIGEFLAGVSLSSSVTTCVRGTRVEDTVLRDGDFPHHSLVFRGP